MVVTFYLNFWESLFESLRMHSRCTNKDHQPKVTNWNSIEPNGRVTWPTSCRNDFCILKRRQCVLGILFKGFSSRHSPNFLRNSKRYDETFLFLTHLSPSCSALIFHLKQFNWFAFFQKRIRVLPGETEKFNSWTALYPISPTWANLEANRIKL